MTGGCAAGVVPFGGRRGDGVDEEGQEGFSVMYGNDERRIGTICLLYLHVGESLAAHG